MLGWGKRAAHSPETRMKYVGQNGVIVVYKGTIWIT